LALAIVIVPRWRLLRQNRRRSISKPWGRNCDCFAL